VTQSTCPCCEKGDPEEISASDGEPGRFSGEFDMVQNLGLSDSFVGLEDFGPFEDLYVADMRLSPLLVLFLPRQQLNQDFT